MKYKLIPKILTLVYVRKPYDIQGDTNTTNGLTLISDIVYVTAYCTNIILTNIKIF